VRVELLELEPGEVLMSTTGASFRGAAATSARSTVALGSNRMRQEAFIAWRDTVAPLGFPTAGPEMRLCVTNRRFIVCRTSFWMNRPTGVAGSLPLSEIAEVAYVRHGWLAGLAIAVKHRGIVELESLRGRRLRRFANTLQDALSSA
jgi:hypothetical protein